MAPPTKPKAPNRELAPRDAKAFKELLAEYEQKNFKKALKTADGILGHKPNHGETLCMKGLLLHNTGKQEEGYALVKEGTRNDVESHICWHVHALMLKADKRYREALDCYIQACSRERDQPNLIRDAITLQLNFRMFEDVVEQRARMVKLQPRIRANWLALSVALYLAGRHVEASKTLLSYLDMQKETPKRDYEISEAVLFRAQLLSADGKVDDALAWLDEKSSLVVDRPALDRLRAELLLQTDQSIDSNRDSTQFTWNALFEGNVEDRRNVYGILRSRGITHDDPARRSDALVEVDRLAEKAPGSTTVRMIGLRLDEGTSFEKRVRKLLREWILKGVPSLFHAVRPLYIDDAKRQAIESIVEGFRTSLERDGTLDETTEADQIDAPTTYVWTTYFLSQHYSHLDQHDLALQHIDAALAHTPALPDLLMIRARVLKRAGDLLGAEQAMTAARELDGQDRFLNCKAVKYLLRLNQAEEGERIAGLFTRKEAPSPLADLTDLQALWFLQEQGDAYRRSKRFNLALKRYHTIEKIFSDWREDESDFHQWCNRKGTMRTYLKLLKWEDRLRSQPAFTRAARGAIAIYLELDARPPQANGVHENGDANGNAEADEAARKAAKKAKKAEAKARAQGILIEPKKEETNLATVDPDPNGDQLLATENPLEQAAKFLRDLEMMAADRSETWLLSFDVAIRRKQLLHALKALRHATTIDKSSPELAPRLIELKQLVAKTETDSSSSSAEMTDYVRRGVDELIGFPSSEALIADLLQRHPGSPTHILAAMRSLIVERGPDGAKAEVESLAGQMDRTTTTVDLEVMVAILDVLRSIGSSQADDFRAMAASRMPLANAFMTPEQLDQHKISLQQLSRSMATAHTRAVAAGDDAVEMLDG